jgi:outer membrane biosynthesis protein TonB
MEGKNILKAYNGDKGYIFVSYNHDDEEVVYRIISDLQQRGYRVWYDAGGISVGENFVKALADRIKNCEIFLCFLSPRYIDSPYCRRELNFALSNLKRTVPIKIENFTLPDVIKFELSGINWINLTKFPSSEKMVDRLCDITQEFLRPCYEEAQDESQTEQEQPDKTKLSGGKKAPEEQKPTEDHEPVEKPKLSGGKKPSVKQQPSEKQEPIKESKPPEKPKWLKYLPYIVIGVLAIIALILALTVFNNKGEQPGPSAQPTSAVTASSVQTDAGKQKEAKSSAAPATAAPLPPVKPEDLASSGQKAVRYLSERAEEGCPMTVYDPAGTETEEADAVYDNALAALALLADNSKNKNHSDSDIRLILDSLAELANDGTIFTENTGTKSLVAASLALMQYDRAKTSFSYARAAQTILDRILETCSYSEGGFRSGSTSGDRSTADNIWLHAAFSMLADKTGESRYSDAARSAEKYVLSMRSPDGSFYLSGDAGDAAFVSADIQALAAIVMNDRTGISRALELRRTDGGFSPDNQTPDGFSTESTLLMALAFRNLGMEDEASQALSAVYRYQMDNGSVPGTNIALLTDGQGIPYRNLPKTSAAAWYIMAAEGYSPF